MVLADINETGVRAKAKEIGGDALAITLNVTEAEGWKQTVKTIVETFGRLDIVCNNAGTSYRNKATLEVTAEEFDRVFAVNVKSIFLSVQTVVHQLKKNGGGSIINISSIGSLRPRPGLVWYNASKGAVSNVCYHQRPGSFLPSIAHHHLRLQKD